jgi:ribonuclease P protein component
MSDNKTTRQLRLVDELVEVAKRVGVEVRRERILREVGYRARGGACRLREKDLLIIDRDQPPSEQIEVLAEALRKRNVEELYLSPAARRVLQGEPE